MAKSPKRANYSQEEVQVLVEEYEELKCLKGTERWRLALLCQLMDITSAIKRLGPKEYQAVLLVGQLNLSIWVVGPMLGVSHQTMWRRYTRGLEMLTTDLNGSR